MSLAKRYPIVGIVAGIVLIVIGISSKNNIFLITGIVLIALSLFRRFRS